MLLIWNPDLRLGVRAYLGCVWMVVAWFLLARTKSLTWSGYMHFFAACVPWSFAVGMASQIMATSGAGTFVLAPGPSVAIASITEETLKLVPIAVVAALAPRRTSRFADWIDSAGVSYDAVGNFPSEFFDKQWKRLQLQIVRHFDKADLVPVDVSQFSSAQRRLVSEFIAQFPERVFLVGE